MRDAVQQPSRRSRPLHGVMALAVVAAAGAVGSRATLPAIPTWYAGLAKPAFTPPNWVFGPAWTVLYALMAAAFYRVLGQPRLRAGRVAAITVFLAHMALNALWSVLFFRLRDPLAGLADIVPLCGLAALTAILFGRLDRTAGWLMVPNLLWVSFAAALNWSIWRMN